MADLSIWRKTDRPEEWEGLVDPDPINVEFAKGVEQLTDEEKYLAVLLQDHSGLDISEFCWKDPNRPDGRYRAQPSQWAWWREREPRTMDASARSVGKCLGGDSKITLANGQRVAISSLVGQTPEIMAWDDTSGTVQPAPTMAIYCSGEKPTVLLRSRLGRELVATGDHRLLTPGGWRTAGDLAVGDRVASPAIYGPSEYGDIIWDVVTSIEPAGTQETFDITMVGDPNFLADDIVVHNSESIMADALQFPFNFPGAEFLITAPEGQHVESLTDRIEARIRDTRLLTEMLVKSRSGIKHKPFVATFQNGARVYARLPQRSGIGLKGTHPVILHVDEAQDMSERAWMEMPEIVRNDVPGNKWKIHGVSKGIQGDSFDKYSRPGSGFKVFQITGLHREGWSVEERDAKVKQYGGSDRSPDFLRNVYGIAGAASNRIFVLTRLMACTDVMEASEYNTSEYYKEHIAATHIIGRLADSGLQEIEASTDQQADTLRAMIQPPASHTEKYDIFWMGADVGVVNDPTEIVVFAEYIPTKAEKTRDRRANVAVPDAGLSRFKLMTRIRLEGLPLPLQAHAIMHLIDIYKPRAFTLDRTGIGQGLLQNMQQIAGSARFVVASDAEAEDAARAIEARHSAARDAAARALPVIKGYNFSEKVIIGIDEKIVNDLGLTDPGTILDKAAIKQHAKDAATDVLRDLVDTRRLLLPYDPEVIDQMNGQTWMSSQEPVDKYGRRRAVFSIGQFHILDGCRMFALGWAQQPIEEMFAEARKPAAPVLVQFGL